MLQRRIYDINEHSFESVALEVYRFQFEYNPVYRQFNEALQRSPKNVNDWESIPFLPISFFVTHDIQTGVWEPVQVFRSSGTTGMTRSRHLLRDLEWYHEICHRCFPSDLGQPAEFVWLGLLPSYLERPDSSLVDMVSTFMKAGNHHQSGFFASPESRLIEVMQTLRDQATPTILMGVSFALLDLFEQYNVPVWDQLKVIETGGMKGRKKELTRIEMHERLQLHHTGLNICSEYGMTELLSQAYDVGNGFQAGPTMRILIREISDPFQTMQDGRRGVIHAMDLANLDSCSFIATEDVGLRNENGAFEVLGRVDHSDLRGCNLMYT